jgi:hypothetical protein
MWNKDFSIESAVIDGRFDAQLTGYKLPRLELLPTIDRPNKPVEIDGRNFFVIEGDLLLDSDELLLFGQERGPVPEVAIGGLTGMKFGGEVVRWRESDFPLRFCVIKASFSSEADYIEVCKAMRRAADAWARTCGVRFEHLDQFDAHEDPTTYARDIDARLLFVVRGADAGGKIIASAFLPTQGIDRHKIFIDPSFFTTDFDHVGVLRHELGHVLGFRHEHIRSGAPAVCPSEIDAGELVDLTKYDPKSVMHYFCGGVGSRELAITQQDRKGARLLYGQPLGSSQRRVSDGN